jgi:hypothetical protein
MFPFRCFEAEGVKMEILWENSKLLIRLRRQWSSIELYQSRFIFIIMDEKNAEDGKVFLISNLVFLIITGMHQMLLIFNVLKLLK